jgi:DNA-binding NtrC family response regulator
MESSATILVVEDDDSIRLTLRDFLESRGHTVLVASEGVGAIKILIDNDVDALITDFRMELFGGGYWLKFLERFCPKMPVVVVSGYLDPDTKLVFPYFAKPFDYDEIEEKVRELIHNGRT